MPRQPASTSLPNQNYFTHYHDHSSTNSNTLPQAREGSGEQQLQDVTENLANERLYILFINKAACLYYFYAVFFVPSAALVQANRDNKFRSRSH